MIQLWFAVLVGVSIYCAVQAYRDIRRGGRLMAALGVACILALWLTPIYSPAVKFDLVENSRE